MAHRLLLALLGAALLGSAAGCGADGAGESAPDLCWAVFAVAPNVDEHETQELDDEQIERLLNRAPADLRADAERILRPDEPLGQEESMDAFVRLAERCAPVMREGDVPTPFPWEAEALRQQHSASALTHLDWL